MVRTDEKLRNLLEFAFQATIILNDINLIKLVYQFSRQNTFMIRVSEELMKHLVCQILKSLKPDFELIVFLITSKILVVLDSQKKYKLAVLDEEQFWDSEF